ncbi:hypothetical protein SQ11_02490 [Nitrosospira sp. NpAV]|nr:hypothetical protein SQ11_02490 [Nitrosospira sp. NpAV]
MTAACFSFLLLSLRYWLLPDIERYRETIASAISHASGQHVTLGEISANWDGFRPHMMLRTIKVHDKAGNISLLLHQLEGTLSWRSLLHGELRFREIGIEQPDLIVRRDPAGAIHVAGFALNSELTDEENGFSDWLLRQRQVIINNASILWQDDLRGAPELELLVNLRLENHGNRHRFGIRAIPPAELAAQLDIRGDFTGESLGIPEQWRGQLFTQIDHADIAAALVWLPFPPEIKFNRGIGALRMWSRVDRGDMKKLTADMRLHNVKVQLAQDLPELSLIRLRGRVGWQTINEGTKEGIELFARGLSASVRGEGELTPVNFSVQMISPGDSQTGTGKLSVDDLSLEIVGNLAEYFPINQSLREQLGKLSPRGEIHSMRAKWDGEWQAPRHFNAKGRFTNLSMKKSENLPAFSGVTGNIDVTEGGGTLNLNSQKVRLELPEIFQEPLMLDIFTGQASWNYLTERNSIAFKFNNITFSNSHAAGLAYGSYRFTRGKPGVVDLTGHLTRADASYLRHYTPVTANPYLRDWLGNFIVAGEFLDARLHLKGNLADFPFSRGNTGIFRLHAKASEVVLDHIPGWPRIENISGNLQLQGSDIRLDASRGSTSGVALSKVKVRIADATASDAMLQSEGEANGRTSEFLTLAAKYIAKYTGSFADDVGITGNGKLLFKLDIPLHNEDGIKLAGNYQFMDNQINPGARIPNLEKVNGILAFSGSEIKIENVTAQFLGGPVIINSTIMPGGGMRVSANGKANLGNLYQQPQSGTVNTAQLWSRYLRGSTDWRATIQTHDKLADISVESSLHGVTLDLPEPFSKTATSMATLRFERKASDKGDLLNFSYGGLVTAKIRRLQDKAGNHHVERGIVNFGTGPALLPEKKGISVTGTLPSFDLDYWQNMLGQFNDEMAPAPNLANINVHIGTLDVLGKRLNDITLNASKEHELWHSTVASKEIKGGVSWNPAGNGKIVARLRTLSIPADSPVNPGLITPTPHRENSLSGFDVMADNFVIGEKHLGALELIAGQHEQGWRVEKLHITNSDSSLTARGIWQSHATPPRVQTTVTLNATDIGDFLTHLGYPDHVKRGSGRVEGELSWHGSPRSIDYPTLSGNLKIKARRGQFPRFEPGIGRLFGMFDLRALPRRITLDFHDVFSEGFGFDDISGDVKITRGVAATDDLRIEGPAAKILMDGELNLEAETQKLHVTVTPSLGLATPVVGIVSHALQNSPPSKQYNVTGTWADPIITRISWQPQEQP